mgnify:CR=1 FL=1
MSDSLNASLRRAGWWSWLLLPALVLVILGIDQFAKHLVQARLEPYGILAPIPALSHLFTLTFVKNTGAAFGFFPNGSTLFVIVALIVSAGIAIYFRHIPRDEWLVKISLSMQLGGAMGNLLDRVRLGYVVDFMDFRMWPVFNFADTFIVVGVMLLAYRLVLRPGPPLFGGDAPERGDGSDRDEDCLPAT